MKIEHVGIIGAGTMGRGIAQDCAVAGLDVTLVDVSEEVLQRAVEAIDAGLARLVRNGKLSAEAQAAAMARIETSVRYSALAAAPLVIEAATENIALKLKILRDAEGVIGATALLATNTSSISISQLAAVLDRPERCIGLHFFNPVPVMKLVEVIRGLETSDATAEVVTGLATRIGKTPIAVRNSPGFVVNRILCPMINEAIFVLQEGLAAAQEIDDGLKLGCNHPIGPLALADLIGLDTMLAVMQVFHASFGDPKYRPAPLLKEMVDAGRLGRKSGQGFYAYAAR